MDSRNKQSRIKPYLKRVFAMFLLSIMATLGAHSAGFTSTQLIMLEEDGCPYCAKFNREIGPVYPKTTEGKTAPLRRVFLYDKWPDDLKDVKPDTVTPTFILVHDSKEVGRLRGYNGDEFFWYLLNELLAKLPPKNTP